MPDTLDRLQDGTAAAILFRTIRHCFHPAAQTLLNSFREPQKAVLEVQGALESPTLASALFADLSKAFECINAHWILHILYIRQCSSWVLQLAKHLLLGRRIRHKVQGRLLPARQVHSGVDMGRSISVYFFCLAMDPIFVVLHQIPRVLVVAGYVDDTTIVGHQEDPQRARIFFRYVKAWKTAGIVMDVHNCWQTGFSSEALAENTLLKTSEVWGNVTPIHEVLRHGDHCILMSSDDLARLSSEGHPLLCQLAASPCQCRSKTQLLTNTEYSPAQLYQLDRAGLGGQCIIPSTVNLGRTLHTGWTCQLNSESMTKVQMRTSVTALLAKQLAKFRSRLAAAERANLSINAKIIYFNTFSLSLFYYSQTHRYFFPPLLKPIYRAMAKFLLRRHWFPQRFLVGLCRWLRIGPLLDASLMHAISLFGCYLRQGHTSLSEGPACSYANQVFACWKYWQTQLSTESVQKLVEILRQSATPMQRAGKFKMTFKQLAVTRLIETSQTHLANRMFNNGWSLGPSIDFLRWLSELPILQVGAVPRYAVLRWALGEDADSWLPLRGKLNRSQPCLWYRCNTRCFPNGPGHGAICPSCCDPATAMEIALRDLPEENIAQLRYHNITIPTMHQLPPAIVRLPLSEGCRRPDSYIPYVLCQQGVNSIKHWLSFCQVPHLAWLALWTSTAPELQWRTAPTKAAGVAMCYLLFHLRRLVIEYGGLQPVIARIRVRPLMQHVLDLWQRTYRSLPSTLLRRFRARRRPVTRPVLSPLKSVYSDSPRSRWSLLYSRVRVFAPSRLSSRETPSLLSAKLIVAYGSYSCNTGNSRSRLPLPASFHTPVNAGPLISSYGQHVTYHRALSFYSMSQHIGRVAWCSLMDLLTRIRAQEEQESTSFMLRKIALLWFIGRSPCFPAQTMSLLKLMPAALQLSWPLTIMFTAYKKVIG